MSCASFVPKNALVCDVGSDHAYIPLYLIKNNIVKNVIISDINDAPLSHAKETFRNEGITDKATFVLCDGIKELYKFDPNCFIIAGMSGETIINILSLAFNEIKNGDIFILQPMSRDHYLRKYLYEAGFDIIDEKCVFENGKSFISIKSVYVGKKHTFSDEEYYLGKFFNSFENIPKEEYLNKKLFSVNVKIHGKKSACEDTSHEEAFLKNLEVLISK